MSGNPEEATAADDIGVSARLKTLGDMKLEPIAPKPPLIRKLCSLPLNHPVTKSPLVLVRKNLNPTKCALDSLIKKIP